MKDEDRETEAGKTCKFCNVDTCSCCPVSCLNAIENDDSGRTGD